MSVCDEVNIGHADWNNKIVTSSRQGDLFVWDINKSGASKFGAFSRRLVMHAVAAIETLALHVRRMHSRLLSPTLLEPRLGLLRCTLLHLFRLHLGYPLEGRNLRDGDRGVCVCPAVGMHAVAAVAHLALCYSRARMCVCFDPL